MSMVTAAPGFYAPGGLFVVVAMTEDSQLRTRGIGGFCDMSPKEGRHSPRQVGTEESLNIVTKMQKYSSSQLLIGKGEMMNSVVFKGQANGNLSMC